MPRCLPGAIVILPEPPLELKYVSLVAFVSGSLEVVCRIIMMIGALQGLRVGGPGGLFLELHHDSNCIEHFNFKFLTQMFQSLSDSLFLIINQLPSAPRLQLVVLLSSWVVRLRRVHHVARRRVARIARVANRRRRVRVHIMSSHPEHFVISLSWPIHHCILLLSNLPFWTPKWRKTYCLIMARRIFIFQSSFDWMVARRRWSHIHRRHHRDSSVGIGARRHVVRRHLIRVHVGRRWSVHVRRVIRRRVVSLFGAIEGTFIPDRPFSVVPPFLVRVRFLLVVLPVVFINLFFAVLLVVMRSMVMSGLMLALVALLLLVGRAGAVFGCVLLGNSFILHL